MIICSLGFSHYYQQECLVISRHIFFPKHSKRVRINIPCFCSISEYTLELAIDFSASRRDITNIFNVPSVLSSYVVRVSCAVLSEKSMMHVELVPMQFSDFLLQVGTFSLCSILVTSISLQGLFKYICCYKNPFGLFGFYKKRPYIRSRAIYIS